MIFAISLAACGGGGSSGTPGSGPTGSTINVTYTKGPVSGASAIILDANSKTVAGPVTTLDGQATFTGVSYIGPVYARFSGGSYTDEATGAIVNLANSFQIRSGVLNNDSSGSLQLTATPLTEIGFKRAEAAAGTGVVNLNNVNSFIDQVADDYGLDNINLTTVVPKSLQNITGDTDSDRYGTVLAAITQQQTNAGDTPGTTSLQNYIATNTPGIDQFAFATAVRDLQTNSNTSSFINDTVIGSINTNAGTATGSHTIGGSLNGLTGSIILQNNGAYDLSLNNDGPFTFNGGINNAATYSITILTQPTGQTCSVINGSGIVSGANVLSVSVACVTDPLPTYTIGGTVNGLSGSVVIQNNGVDDLVISTDGVYSFTTRVLDSDVYDVQIVTQSTDQACMVSNGTGSVNGGDVNNISINCQAVKALYDENTVLEPITSYVREDGVVVTRFGDRGRDRHAKDIGFYDPNNIFNSDHYDHYLAHYWEYRTARIQLEDHVPNGTSLIRATYITESQLGAKEFRVWFWGVTTTGQFHFNPVATFVGKGTWNDDFVKISETGHQYMYTLDIVNKWQNGGQFQPPLQAGMNMEFEISQFLLNPPAGARLNYYGTSYVYVIGTPGLAPFEWQRGVNNPGGSNDGTPIPAIGLLGGDGTLGYNYSEEPAGRFMQMATNLSPGNAQPFVRGRRVHHTNFEDGSHDERHDNPVWTEQIGKAGNHYINLSCTNCHVRNGRALVADVGVNLDKWVFKVGDANGNPDPLIGKVLQPDQIGSDAPEGTVSLGAWTELTNGLRSPNYVFSNGTPARFSARIAPQLVGIGLLDAVPESTILEWADPLDENADGISGRAAISEDPLTGVGRLGRFGYKAATSSVKHQIAVALNTDIGVMTSMLPDPDCGSLQASCGATGQELADDQLNDLVKYISLLGVGARRDYDDTGGETLFTSIGCAGCHRGDTMTTSAYHPLAELRSQTIQPYTDMLLHDMGAGLADNHGEGIATGAEWRTAPLWGLGHARSVMLGDPKANDSVSMAGSANDVNRIGYLHDGRARTIDEAIRWHGGEAIDAKTAYEALSDEDEAKLLDFLDSL